MSKKRLLLHIIAILILIVPNMVYFIANSDLIEKTHAITISVLTMLVFSIVGIGTLCHFKVRSGIWMGIIGAFILALSDISYVAGIALIIEGLALTIDSYIIKPIIIEVKTKELEAHGKSITYTRSIDGK